MVFYVLYRPIQRYLPWAGQKRRNYLEESIVQSLVSSSTEPAKRPNKVLAPHLSKKVGLKGKPSFFFFLQKSIGPLAGEKSEKGQRKK